MSRNDRETFNHFVLSNPEKNMIIQGGLMYNRMDDRGCFAAFIYCGFDI